jgi:DNA polymerase I-like protein with 3'-5' exonuclease and polymerase domains
MPIVRPNIRSIFVPDPGYILVDADLKGADAQVVAWEANDAQMKKDLRSGVKIHDQTATAFFGDTYRCAVGDRGNKHSPKGRMYDDIKRATHGTNYGASGKTLALNLGWPLHQGRRFHDWWLHEAHPGIGTWHANVERSLRTSRSVSNAFGYRVIYYDRIDGLLPEALAWIPQSTVALVSFMGAVKLRKKYKFIEFLLQVHDSIVFQIPRYEAAALTFIQRDLDITVPYPDPLVIGSKLQYSMKSWGHMIEFNGTFHEPGEAHDPS